MALLFTSESVFPGHPDLVCDQISDGILDAILEKDGKARVAVETMVTTDLVVLAGEVTTTADIDYEEVARRVIRKIGYTKTGIGFNVNTVKIESHIHSQSPDISQGVDVGGAGDNGLMFGCAVRQSPDLMPWPIHLSRALQRKFRDVCATNSDFAELFNPDGKVQVTVKYFDYNDECDEGKYPKRIAVPTVVFNVQHIEEVPDNYREMIKEQVIYPVLNTVITDLSETTIHINPTGKFVVGGPNGDTGLTGRKIVVATYGGWERHGGGAQSGKDPTKVDKSALLLCRNIAKTIVDAGIVDEACVQVAYAIGVVQPVSIQVTTDSLGSDYEEVLNKVVAKLWDCSVEGILREFKLTLPMEERGFSYEDLAAYGYIGEDVTFETGDKLPWEQTLKKDLLREEYESALKAACL